MVRDLEGHRTALCDVAERPSEWDTLRELVARYGPGIAVSTPPPGHPFLGRDPGGGAGAQRKGS